MPNTDRTSIRQRAVDAAAAALITIVATILIFRWAHPHPIHHLGTHILYGIWAFLLTASGITLLVGVILRTLTPGRRQNIGIQAELWGWGASSFLVFWYATLRVSIDHDLAMFGAILLVSILLLSPWLKIMFAWREARRRRMDRIG
jgi:hypothetical protein